MSIKHWNLEKRLFTLRTPVQLISHNWRNKYSSMHNRIRSVQMRYKGCQPRWSNWKASSFRVRWSLQTCSKNAM